MADQNEPMWRAPEPSAEAVAVPSEFVLRGLFFALAAVIGGSILSVVLWEAGYIASITSFIIAIGGVFLYAKGAGAPPRKGLIPLILLIVLGVVGSFFAIVGTDLWNAFPQVVTPGTETRETFISDNIFNGALLKSYGGDMAMYFVFAAVGTFGTIWRLARR